MKIELHQISIRDIARNYIDNAEEGVSGYDGKLNIRPKYQREFVYDDKKRDLVIETITKSFPLNVMYWVKNDDGTYEILDGQQRTISFCKYVNNYFSINNRSFANLTKTEKEQILDYEVMVYFCEGNDKEKLEWFRIINIAGEKLTDQELRNATYTGSWLTDAKLKFSKSNCAAYLLAKDYVKGSPIRQEFLETAIKWISEDNIENYMSINQHKPNASELWEYFKSVINWVKEIFPNYRKEMKGVNWGNLYNKYKDTPLDSNRLEERVKALMMDEDVQRKSGIYEYLLSNDEKYLNLRAFPAYMKRVAYERQGGKCANINCPEKDKKFNINEMEGDHITPWSAGGKTVQKNCQMLCKECNRRKSAR